MLPRPIPGFDAPGAPPMRPPPGFDNAPPPGGRAPPGFDNAPPPTMRPPPGFDNAPPPPQPKSMPGFDNLPRFSTPQQPPSHALPNPSGGYGHHAPPPPAGGGGIGWDAPPSSSAGGPPPRSSFDRPAPPLMAPPHMGGGGGGGGYQGGHHHGGGGGGAPGGYGGPSPYGGGPSGYGGGGPPRPPPRSFQARDPTNTVWVGSVDPSMSEEFIATRFAPYGRVLRVSRHVDKGMAFVHFRTVEEAAAAVENLPSTGALPPQMKLSFGKMFQYDNDGNELRGGGGGDGGGPSGGPPRGHFEGRRAEYHERRDDDRPRSYDDDYSRRGGPREDYNRPPPPPRDDYRDRPRDDFDRPRDDYRDRPRDDYYRDRPRDDRPRDDYRPRDFDRRDRRDEPTNVLWVGDLVPEVTDDDLQRNFGAYGSIKKISRVQHRNFGFVHFHSVDECSRALHMLRGTQFNGRTLTLRYGNADSDRSGGPGGAGGGFDRPFRDRFEEPTNIVYVGQLPPSASELELRSLFQPYEGFVEIRYSAEKACAFGHFETLDQAKTCKDALQGQSFHGVPLRVSYGKPTGHHGGHVGPAFGPAGGASKGELTIPGMGGPSGGGMSGALALVAPVSGQASLPTEFGAGGPAPVGSTDARDNAASAPAPAFVTRPRVTPRVTLDRKVAAVIAGSYFGGSVVGPHIGQAQVIDLCNAIDNISSNEDAAIEVKPMLFAAARVNSLHHAVAIVAKRLKEYHNDDPHKKLLGFYCVALVMHQQSPPSKSALDAFVTLASVVSSGLEEAAMSHFRSVLDSLRTYLDGNVSTSDAETLAYFDQIISSCKTQGALASLLKKVKGTA